MHIKQWPLQTSKNLEKYEYHEYSEKKICKRRKEDYATNILKDSNVRFKMKTMFFFNFRESNFFIIYLNNKIILKIHLYHYL